MKKELQDDLFKKYPKLYRQKDEPYTRSLMCFGFACGDGWYNILDTLSAEIQDRVDYINGEGKHAYRKQWLPEDHVNTIVEACQVKEKWGTLRFYFDGNDDFIEGLVSFAESLSAKTCEICGQPGVLETKGWHKVRCKKHEGLPLKY